MIAMNEIFRKKKGILGDQVIISKLRAASGRCKNDTFL